MAIKTYKDKMVHSNKTTKKAARKGSPGSVRGGKTGSAMAGKK